MTEATVSQSRLLELLEKHGRNLHSFMVLEPGLSVWSTDDAAIAYTDRGGFWVAVGGPVCAADQALQVANEFREAAKKQGRGVVFFAVTQPLVDRLAGHFDALQVGLAPIWNPTEWQHVLATSGKLRNRLSKAQRSGLTVRSVTGAELAEGAPLRRRFADIVDSWADHKALPPMGFMVTVELFQHAERRRYFVVESEGVVHGFAVCVPIYGRRGWLLEDMMIRPDAPGGCSELTIDSVMRSLSDEGAEIVSLGMVALAGLDAGEQPTKHPLMTWFLRTCSLSMGWLYNFEGLYRFRNKMNPSAWERVYVVGGKPVGFWTIRAILMAFAGGWIPRFAVRMFGRQARMWFREVPTRVPEESAPKPPGDLWILLLAVGCCFGTVVAVLGFYRGWLPAWASVMIGFLAAYAGFTPIHEAVHGNVSRFRILNNAVGHACALLLNGSFLPYCYLHREHHRSTNEPIGDPDYWCGEGPKWALPIRWLTQDVGYLKYYCSRWSMRPRWERADLLICTALYVGAAVGALLFDLKLFFAVALGWFVPARLALFALAVTFSWLPHEPHRETSPYRATTVRSAPWLTWLLLGQNYHLVHHLDPGKPFYRLASIWRRKREEYVGQGAVDRSEANIGRSAR